MQGWAVFGLGIGIAGVILKRENDLFYITKRTAFVVASRKITPGKHSNLLLTEVKRDILSYIHG